MHTRPLARLRLLVAGAFAFTFANGNASDHLDTAAVIADPASDIGDLYAWASGEGKRLNLVMTIVGGKFSDHVRYEFHIDSGKKLGKTSATTSIACDSTRHSHPTAASAMSTVRVATPAAKRA